jgi:hypothetical protein
MKAIATLTGCLFVATCAFSQAINYNTLGAPVGQNFNGLANTGVVTYVPYQTIAGFHGAENYSGSLGIGDPLSFYVADNGGSNNVSFRSYGATSSVDRAFGAFSANSATVYGFVLQNTTGVTLSQITVSFTVELWRTNSANTLDRLTFAYRVNAADSFAILTGERSEFTAVSDLTFNAVNVAGTTGAIDGDLPQNQTALSSTISGLNWTNGSYLYLRWEDEVSSTLASAGMGIDEFRMLAVPEPFTMSALALGLAAIARKRARRN